MRRTTRQRLIDAAFDLFARNGFHAVGLDRILGEVGISKQAFYHHFESKEDLVLETLRHRHEWEMDNYRKQVRRLGGLSARGQLLAGFDVLHAWFNEPEFEGCIFITAAAEFPNQHEPAHQLACEHKRAVHDEMVRLAAMAGATDPEGLAHELQLLFDGAIVLRQVTGDGQAATRAKRAAEVLLDRALPATEPPAKAPRRAQVAATAGAGERIVPS